MGVGSKWRDVHRAGVAGAAVGGGGVAIIAVEGRREFGRRRRDMFVTGLRRGGGVIDTWYDGGWGGGSGGAPIGGLVVGLRGTKGERSVREAAMVGSPKGADFGRQGGGFVEDSTGGTRVRVESSKPNLPVVCTV